jgi:hypothetical protein
MTDETAKQMYESAREKLAGLLRQEEEVRQQIESWTPIVEQLAKVAGEELDEETGQRLRDRRAREQRASGVGGDALGAGSGSGGPGEEDRGIGTEMGLTEAIRWVFRQPHLLPLTPTQVRNELAEMGYDLSKYAYVMPPIHNTLNRMKEAGEIREVEGVGGLGRAFVKSRNRAESP